jgi:hypothetical protein
VGKTVSVFSENNSEENSMEKEEIKNEKNTF